METFGNKISVSVKDIFGLQMAFKAIARLEPKIEDHTPTNLLLYYLQESSSKLTHHKYVEITDFHPYMKAHSALSDKESSKKFAQSLKGQLNALVSVLTSEFYGLLYLDMLTAGESREMARQIPQETWETYKYYLCLIASAKCPCTYSAFKQTLAQIGVSTSVIDRFAEECLEARDGYSCRLKDGVLTDPIDLSSFAAIFGPNFLSQEWCNGLEANKRTVDPLFVRATTDESLLGLQSGFASAETFTILQSLFDFIIAGGMPADCLLPLVKLFLVCWRAYKRHSPNPDIEATAKHIVKLVKDNMPATTLVDSRPSLSDEVCQDLWIEGEGMESQMEEFIPRSRLLSEEPKQVHLEKYRQLFDKKQSSLFARMAARRQNFLGRLAKVEPTAVAPQVPTKTAASKDMLFCCLTSTEIDSETTTSYLMCNLQYTNVNIFVI